MNDIFFFIICTLFCFSGLILMLYPYYAKRKRMMIYSKNYSGVRTALNEKDEKEFNKWYGLFGSKPMIILGFIILCVGSYLNTKTNQISSTIILWVVISLLFPMTSNYLKGKIDGVAAALFIISIIVLLIM